MSGREPLVVTKLDVPANREEDYMRLSVSEEEAAEFGFDVPSLVVVPSPITAPASVITRAVAQPRKPLPALLQSQIVGANGSSREIGNGDVEMEDGTPQGKLVVETPPCKPVVFIEPAELPGLYSSLGMDLETASVAIPKYRLDTLHARGVDDMSTQDVLNYFASYKPEKVEWVNDTSCNVLFPNDTMAASALKTLSQPLRLSKKPLSTASDSDATFCDAQTGEEVLISDVVSFPIPVPQGTWRVVKSLPVNAKQLILRFARTIDKKPPNAQKYSQYYAKYGNQNGKSGRITADYTPSGVYRTVGRKISSSSSEDHEPFGLCNPRESTIEVLEVDQRPTQGRGYNRFLGIEPERRETFSPYRRSRSDLHIEQDPRVFRQNDDTGFDLRSLLQERSSPSLQLNDLRNRLSDTNRIKPNDLRNRLNGSRRSGF